jgi:hypothetical protein
MEITKEKSGKINLFSSVFNQNNRFNGENRYAGLNNTSVILDSVVNYSWSDPKKLQTHLFKDLTLNIAPPFLSNSSSIRSLLKSAEVKLLHKDC